MKKTFVIDTNVLLHNPSSLFCFEDNDVILPLAVLEEIDHQKRRQDEIGRNAREAARILDELRQEKSLASFVDLPSGGRLRIELNHWNSLELPAALDGTKYDNRILTVCLALEKEVTCPIVLVTKDINLRIKANVLGLRAEDYYNDKVDFCQLYTGVGELNLTHTEMERLFKDASLSLPAGCSAYPNQLFILRNSLTPSQSALARCVQRHLHLITSADMQVFGLKSRNKEQKFALELLMDDRINVVTLVGKAGTGKTLLALAAGIEKTLEQQQYTRILITRPIVPMGDDLGYLPGSKEEKLRPWMQPIYDNLEFLFHACPDKHDVINDYITRDVIQLEALTYIRGRSIPRQFIICDEAQNLSPQMIKTLITRVGEGSKIVFTGDPEQIDHPYLDASSNGLSYLVEALKAEEITGHITLVKGERSRVAELGSRLLTSSARTKQGHITAEQYQITGQRTCHEYPFIA